jgi:hypothetical protein
VEVDRAERVEQALPEPEREHRQEEQPHPAVEPERFSELLQHPTIIPGTPAGTL